MPSFLRNRDLGRVGVLLAASSCLLWSQGSPVGNLNGTIKNSEGKPMAKVLVLVRTERGQHEARTDDQGRFIIPQLTPGKVRVIVGAADMEEIRMDTMVIVNQTTTLNLKMRKPTGATIEVIDNSHLPEVDLDVAKAGSIMTLEAITELPLVSDNRVNDVVNRTPGIGIGMASYVVNGVDPSYNAINVDGVDVRDGNYGTQALKLNNYFIDQVQVLTNGISAKYGNFAGGVVNITTKNGTNEFKGTADYEVTDPKWNARDKLTPIERSWGETPSKVNDQHITVQNYTFTGPIIKDSLFFAWALRNSTPTQETYMTTAAPQFGGLPYVKRARNYRQDGKLSWQIDADNQVFADWNQYSNKSENNSGSNTGLTSVETLSGTVRNVRGYMSVGWLSVLQNNLFLDLKVSQTRNETGGPGQGPTGSDSVVTWESVRSKDHYTVLDNGFGTDIKKQGLTNSGALNFTWIFDKAGTHSVDFGVQATSFTQRSAAGSTPSGYTVNYYGFTQYPTPSPALQYRKLVVDNQSQSSLVWDDPIQGEATTSSWSLYANDSWTLNSHWSFNLGARYDRFHFATSPEGNLANYTSLVPRLSANYDLLGDGHHVLSMSAGIYAAQPLVGDFYNATVTTSPVERTYVYLGAAGNGSDALLPSGAINWASWGQSVGQAGKDHPYQTQDPLHENNFKVDPRVQAPHSKELHLSYRYTGSTQNIGVALTRRWTFDQVTESRMGNATTGIATSVLNNDPSLRQDYYALMLTYDTKVGQNLYLNGNLTWSRNFSNAGFTNGSSTASFGGLIPTSQLNPYGPTPQEDRPLLINADATYKVHLGKGTMNFGLLATYMGKWVESFHQAYVSSGDDLASQGYSDSYSRQFPELGPIWMAPYLKFDLQTGYELPLFKTAKAYAKFNIVNLLNDRRSQGPYTSTDAVDAAGNTPPANGKGSDVRYLPDPQYQGTPYYYQPGRTVMLVVGVRF